jgi:formylglycine-generating enzyme required for sulfatase activity/tRNA A-37 threonylcarbamoyl transferase component Bud32
MERLGRYEILSELGRGAMGIVYKARDPNIDRLVAIKVISPDAGMDPGRAKELRERFKREARAAGRLSHPNIITVFDASEDEGRAFLVMEFVEGTPLDSMLHAGHLFSIEDVASIGMQVAQALDYAHQNGIVHRDIKPANIMLTKTGVAKVADFGIARLAEASVTRTGLAVGTPNYMSPEQVAGHKVDGRSDQFSLGVMLYELLCFEKAFPGDTLTTVLYRIMQEDPIPIRRVNPALPEDVDVVLRKAMAKNPDDRYPRAVDLAQDFQIVASGGTVAVTGGAANLDATMAEGVDTKQLAGLKTQTRPAASLGGETLSMDAPVVALRGAGKKSRLPLIAASAVAALALAIGLGWFFVIQPAQEAKRQQEEQAQLAQQKKQQQEEQAQLAQQKKQEEKKGEPQAPPPKPLLDQLVLAKAIRRDGRPDGESKQFAASDPQVVLLASGKNLVEQTAVRVKWFDPENKEIPPSGVPKLTLDGKGGWRATAELALAGSAKPGRWKAEFSLGDHVTQALSFTVTPPVEAKAPEPPTKAATAPVAAAPAPAPASPPAPSGPRAGALQKRGKDEAEMAFVSGGAFTMGDTLGDGEPAEKPTSRVTLASFWIDRFEVTFDQFAKFVQGGGYKTQGNWEQNRARGGNHPVVNVTWADAVAYCRWADKRLPSEAEWEFSARGPEGRKYPWGNQWDATRAAFRGNRGGNNASSPVGSYAAGASPFGVQDLAGNVWEWTSSLEKPYPYAAADGREDPQVSGPRASRGGSWFTTQDLLRSSARDFPSARSQNDKLGFRCAQSGS